MFTFRWTRSALNELAELWTSAPSRTRSEITAAVALLDQQLRDSPLDRGESRAGNSRVVFVNGLTFDYHVLPVDRLVRVTRVWSP
jgi:hypothetical protein